MNQRIFRTFHTVAFLALLACGCRSSFTPLPPKPTRTYQSILDWSHSNGMPGAILLVRTPKTNFLGVAGWADARRKTPMRPDDEFHIASITKMFVGVTAARLQREGLLNAGLPITNYLPASITSHITNSDRITVRHLLRMQSGIYNFSDNPHWLVAYLFDHHGKWPPSRCLRYVYNKPAVFPPGKGWQYNNSNFVLLGLIIENVSGHPLAAEIRHQLLDPLQLTNTYYELSEPARGNLAHGYETLFGIRTDITTWTTSVPGMSGMVSTASDLVAFVSTICSTNDFLDAATRELLRSQPRPGTDYAGSRDADYPVLGYDWGINWSRAADGKTPVSEAPVFFGHEGDGVGSLCFALHDPKNGITIVWFSSNTLMGFPVHVRRSVQMQHELLEKSLLDLAVEQTREQ